MRQDRLVLLFAANILPLCVRRIANCRFFCVTSCALFLLFFARWLLADERWILMQHLTCKLKVLRFLFPCRFVHSFWYRTCRSSDPIASPCISSAGKTTALITINFNCMLQMKKKTPVAKLTRRFLSPINFVVCRSSSFKLAEHGSRYL